MCEATWTPLCERIERFVTDESGYHAYTRSGRAYVIVRAEALQPPIEDPEAYVSCLWLETLDGFYVLAQQIAAGQPRAWYLLARVEPELRYGFFYRYVDALREKLDVSAAAEVLQRAWEAEP